MEKVFAKAEELADTIKEYVNSRIESIKINAAEKSSVIIANGVARLIVACMFLLFINLGSIALSIVLGEWIGKLWAGFLVVACFYLLIGWVIWLAREKFIQLPVMNALIRQLFKSDEGD